MQKKLHRRILAVRERVAVPELPTADVLVPWLERLLDWQLMHSRARDFAAPNLLSGTTIQRIERHRLEALVLEDAGRCLDTK